MTVSNQRDTQWHGTGLSEPWILFEPDADSDTAMSDFDNI